jgi:tetratricopeptide (TPR) repeat protein
MSRHLNDTDLVHRYLDRSLTDQEKELFEARLQKEPALKTMCQEHQQLIKGIKYAHLQDKLEQLRTLESKLPDLAGKQISLNQFAWQPYWKPLAIAASITLIAVTLVVLNRKEDPAQLYAKYFDVYPNVIEPIDRDGSDEISKRTLAFQAYEAGDYQQASFLFNELLAKKKEPGMLLLQGNSNLILGNTVEARNNFITLINDFDKYDMQGKWYLGLSYLKEGNLKSAKLILWELSDTENSYAKKAKELLKEID